MLDLQQLSDEIIMAPAEPTIPLNTGYINNYPRHPSLKRLQQNFGAHPPTQFESLQHLGKCHTEAFNFMLTDGLKLAIEDLERVEFLIPETGARVGEQPVSLPCFLLLHYIYTLSIMCCPGIWISDVSINRPTVVSGAVGASDKNVYPSEARERGGCYKGKCTVRTGYSINGEKQTQFYVVYVY